MNYETVGKTLVGSSGINGDVFYISKDQKFFLLADGASGAGPEGKVMMGQICVDTAVAHIAQSFTSAEAMLDELMWSINNKLIAVSQEQRANVFGTLVLGYIENNELTVASIGDSPTYFYDGNTIQILAKAQRKHEWMIDAGHMTREQYENYISSLHPWMWSSFNTFIPMVVPNHKIETANLKPGDIVMMCCDGVSDWVSSDEIISELKNEKSGIDLDLNLDLDGALTKLIDTARARSLAKIEYFDDITGIVIRMVDCHV